MTKRDFLSVADFTAEQVTEIVQRSARLKAGESPRPLAGKIIALLFEKPSLRTRVSFEVGIRQLGGDCVYLSREDVGLGVREPVEDVARVLDRWVDGIVARVFSDESLQILAKCTSIPVVNALSDLEHPCQALGDLLTIQEHKGRLSDLRIAFIGDGNNVAASLAIGCGSVGAEFVLAAPPKPEYQIPTAVWEEAKERAAITGTAMKWVELPQHAVKGADVVYTDVWVSMGDEAKEQERLNDFQDYQVNEELIEYAKPDSIFMHDMPVHEGEEVSKGMLDNPRSVVFDQAENRLHAQKAILVELFS